VPWIVALVALAAAPYLPNLDDYFLGDDFDLIQSFYGKPPSYFVALLWSNESGDVWQQWGIDPATGHGFLRPLKIWVLAAQLALWGARPFGFHVVSTLLFLGLVLTSFRLLTRLAPGRPEIAFLGAAIAAVHPVFSEVVPFLTAGEELLAIFLGLVALDGFLAHRLEGRSPARFYVFYVLALLTKESGITVLGLALAYDLLHGRLLTRSRAELRATVRLYAPFVPILLTYFALRWIAFGNFKGGDAFATGYSSIEVFRRFHRLFAWAVVDPTMLSIGGSRWAPAVVAAGVLVLGAWLLVRVRRIGRDRLVDLLFVGPAWYLVTTSVLFGSHFAMRRNGLAIVGLGALAALALDALLDAEGVKRRVPAVLAALALACVLWLPPTVVNAAEFERASEIVAEARAEIEARTRGVPPGSTVLLTNVPQSEVAPYFFGWALQSALKRPFTESDLARHSTVVEERNRKLNNDFRPLPGEYDLEVHFAADRWLTRQDHQRWVGRLVRSGVLRRR
jgi:hypothetical protein